MSKNYQKQVYNRDRSKSAIITRRKHPGTGAYDYYIMIVGVRSGLSYVDESSWKKHVKPAGDINSESKALSVAKKAIE